jgi:hypothetical protein
MAPQSNTAKITLLKKELAVLIDAVDFRRRHLQDISIDLSNPSRVDAGYDEEILEGLAQTLAGTHAQLFGEFRPGKY